MKRILFLMSALLTMTLSISAQKPTPSTVIGPVNSYGFLAGPDGSQWIYTTSVTKQYGFFTSVTVEVFDANNQLVGKIVDSLKIDDENVTGVRDLQITSFVTKKFFNFDNNYELMMLITANTKQYVNKYFSRVYSIAADVVTTEPVCEMPGYMVASKNLGEYNENYTTIFKRDSTDIHYFDVYTKASYASPKSPELKHTFEIPYANLAAMNDLFPIFMVKNDGVVNYFTTQYELPFFVPGTPVYEDPIVNENNSLVITQYDNKFNIIGQTKIAMAKDPSDAYLYTFYSMGALSGEQDIILNYNGTGKPAFIITEDNYEIASDGSVYSYRLYDSEGQLLNTICEHALGTIYLSDVAGHERQYGFMKNENDIEQVQFVNVPSCEMKARVALNNGGATLSGNWDRVAKGDSYQYVCPLLQGDNASDGTVTQRIAWLTNKGKVDHYDAITLGKDVEAAQVWTSAQVLNPYLFNADDAYEYAALIKRTGVDGNILVISNTKGEILFELGADKSFGGSLNMVDVVNMHSNNPLLLCVTNDGADYTLNYFALPLTKTAIAGAGTAEDPYQISSVSDFMSIEQAPDAYYVLVNDVDFMSVPFAGINVAFTGVLDGRGHSLKNIVLDGSGLFGAIQDDAVIKDLAINDVVMQLGEVLTPAGILANMAQGNMSGADGSMDVETVSATIHNVHVVSAKVVGDMYKGMFGGLVGDASLFVAITQCSVDAAIALPLAEGIGGVAGKLATSSYIKACAFSGSIDGGTSVGGLVSEAGSGEVISDCHVDAILKGSQTIGGVIAYSQRAPINGCYVEGELVLNDMAEVGKVGGMIGHLEIDETGEGPLVITNCLVGLTTITLPIDSVYAHRVIGFSAGDKYNYFEQKYEDPELKIKDCYVVSTLEAIDAAVALTDTTTEGATIAWETVTSEWLTTQGFVFGKELNAPWVLGNDLDLWYEVDGIFSGVNDVWMPENNTSNADVQKVLDNGRIWIIRNGNVYDITGARVK